VTRLVVCDPRRNTLLQEGNQNDRIDARKMAELLQNNQLRFGRRGGILSALKAKDFGSSRFRAPPISHHFGENSIPET
jgi:hypothetical protein